MSFILLYGKPGTGKTTMACTMAKLGYKVHFIDADGKIPHMENIRHLLESNQVTYATLQSKLLPSTLHKKALTPKLALAKQPKGYLEFADLIDNLEALKEKGDPPPADVLVVDSLTTVIEHFKRLVMHMNIPGDVKSSAKLEFDHWNALLANLEEIFMTLSYLHGWFRHIIVICHERTDTEGTGDSFRVTGILPAIEGSMRDKVGKYFEEVYNLRTRQKGKDVLFECLTKPINLFMARTSRDLSTEVESDFSVIFKGEK
jgi:adenylate kinase family enzyme